MLELPEPPPVHATACGGIHLTIHDEGHTGSAAGHHILTGLSVASYASGCSTEVNMTSET